MMLTKEQIIALAQESLDESRLNNFSAIGYPKEKIWAGLDAGFAAGDDPLFAFCRRDIGDFYWSPAEAFRQIYPESRAGDSDLTVLSLCFYMAAPIKKEQNEQKDRPGLRWGYARNSWEPLIQDFSRRLTDKLSISGLRAAAVDLAPDLAWQESPKYGKAANWSQRHTAYIAGLGTFGLCDGLIGRHGKAARYTSVILETVLEPDKRPYKHYTDWCLFYQNGSCGVCRQVCPAGAIGEQGHDKDKCSAYLLKICEDFDHPALTPRRSSWCGLCQGRVPCQNGIPEGIPNDVR
ncbi:MAG: 4Fe-4S ferredoxin [Clostridia bacterium]|nr:4Fe-4S ferredoxin [Clostridia bacterium]